MASEPRALRVAVLTISTSVAHQRSEDLSGPLLAALVEGSGFEVSAMEVIPDDYALIEDRLHNYVDGDLDVILTTGGTGLSGDDVTPQAAGAVIEREVPGIAEALRAESLRHTPLGMLSREVAGTSARTLIVTLPGSPRAVTQLYAVLEPVLAHAVAVIRGEGTRHGRD
jgi:molybdenum cofactor synthesis domain-containing protein